MSLSKNAIILLTVVVVLAITAVVGAYTLEDGIPEDGVFHISDAIEQGEGSGLDADTLDGLDSTSFVRVSEDAGPSNPALLLTGHAWVEESVTKVERSRDGSLSLDHYIDSARNNQRVYAVPGSFPDQDSERGVRLIVHIEHSGLKPGDSFVREDDTFCYTTDKSGHTNVGGGYGDDSSKPDCKHLNWDGGPDWDTHSNSENDYFWISTSSGGDYEAQPCRPFGIDGDVGGEGGWKTRKDEAIVCHIDLGEYDLEGLEVHTADYSNNYGNWRFDIYWQYI